MKKIGLRVDVDFEVCLTKGVPFFLDFFKRNNIAATFFVALGPDGFRNCKKRLGSEGYARRVLSFNPLKIISKFGCVYLARQFLGPPGNVGERRPSLLKDISERGHELGLHGYDHYWWAENIWMAGPEEIRMEMEKGITAFRKITGEEPKVWASPNWRCSEESLRLVEEYGFDYGADFRGESPFRPSIEGRGAKTVQLPITLPCLHEARQFLGAADRKAILQALLSRLNTTYNVLCIHGYYEGILERDLFIDLAAEVQRRGFQFVPLKDLHAAVKEADVPICEISRKQLPGGRGMVSFQGKEAQGK